MINIYEDLVEERQIINVMNEHVGLELTGVWAEYLVPLLTEMCDECGREDLTTNGVYMEAHLGVPHDVEAWVCFQDCMSQCQEKECTYICLDNDMEGEPCGMCDKYFCLRHLYGDEHLNIRVVNGMWLNYCAKCWTEAYPEDVLPFPLEN